MAAPKFFRVVDGPVNIRVQPDTDAAKTGNQLQTGQQVEVVPESRKVNDGYVWWQHPSGWSVECTENGAAVFMREVVPETDKAKGTDVVNLPVASYVTLPTGARIDRPTFFQKPPVRLEDTGWIQYFGNTWFAFNLSVDRNPLRQKMYFYCQSLHGGIDYGNNTPGIPVMSGVNGIIEKIERGGRSYLPNCIHVKIGDFTMIYGHLGNLSPNLAKGQSVTPDTMLGTIEQTQFHLHLEVRYKTWILNPLLFMPTDMSAGLINKFNKFSKHFYMDMNWIQWQTPFDQPVLKCTTPDKAVIIGPRAARG